MSDNDTAMIEHDCGSLRECAWCGDLTACRGQRRPTCEACAGVKRTGRAPAGRVCLEPGCETVLSVYNSRPRCSLHIRMAAGAA
ncbi:MAG TPA: hypothetical protein VGH10_01835 [Actinomycetota bacterium]|jgi:hypothetical protein